MWIPLYLLPMSESPLLPNFPIYSDFQTLKVGYFVIEPLQQNQEKFLEYQKSAFYYALALPYIQYLQSKDEPSLNQYFPQPEISKFHEQVQLVRNTANIIESDGLDPDQLMELALRLTPLQKLMKNTCKFSLILILAIYSDQCE